MCMPVMLWHIKTHFKMVRCRIITDIYDSIDHFLIGGNYNVFILQFKNVWNECKLYILALLKTNSNI